MCEWAGCPNKGPHRAPKGRENSREYWHFCLDHVREYNQSYNFFQGMNAGRGRALPEGRADRPSSDLEDGRQYRRQGRASRGDLDGAADPFQCSPSSTAAAAGGPVRRSRPRRETRKVMNAERKALQVMGLAAEATLEDVKAKYKALVKQHHPDANGGDRSTEDRLIEIIKAYNYLKTVVKRGVGLSSVVPRTPGPITTGLRFAKVSARSLPR